MPQKFDKGEMLAHVGSSAAQQSKSRVKRVLPEYFEWPRRLRRLYIMLSTHGSSDLAIKGICSEFGWDFEETWEMVAGEHNFLERLIEFRESGEYPKLPQWRNALSYEHLSIVYAEESRFDQMLHLEDQKATGQGGAHARKMVEDAGFFDQTEKVGDKPSIALDRGERPAGIVVDAEATGKMVEARREASLVGEWDAYGEEEYGKDTVKAELDNAGDTGDDEVDGQPYKTSPYSA